MSGFTTGCFTLSGKAPGTHLIGGWVRPIAALDAVDMRKIPFPCLDSSPGRPACSLVTVLTELPQFHAQFFKQRRATSFFLKVV